MLGEYSLQCDSILLKEEPAARESSSVGFRYIQNGVRNNVICNGNVWRGDGYRSIISVNSFFFLLIYQIINLLIITTVIVFSFTLIYSNNHLSPKIV